MTIVQIDPSSQSVESAHSYDFLGEDLGGYPFLPCFLWGWKEKGVGGVEFYQICWV